MSDKLIRIIATFFYIGYSPVAPGTAASLAAAFLSVLLAANWVVYVTAFIVFTGLGFLVSGRMEELENKKDASCIVIDEVSGIFISFFLLPPSVPVFLTTFFLFRAFDMFKIPPANGLQSLKGSTGVMVDDIVAGIYTNIVMQVAVRWAGLV